MTTQGLEELQTQTQASIARLISQRRGSGTVDVDDRVTASNIMFVTHRFIKESTEKELTKARLDENERLLDECDDLPVFDGHMIPYEEIEGTISNRIATLTTELNQEKL